MAGLVSISTLQARADSLDWHEAVALTAELAGAMTASGATRILYRDGKLYVIGNTDPGGDNGHSSAIAIAKLDATTGALDPTFGDGSGPLPGSEIFDPQRYPDGYDFANAAAFASNGDVLVGGSAQNNDGQGSDGFVLALDPSSGAADTAFGDGGYAWFSFDTGVHFDGVSVRAIQVRDDGRILIAGDANHDDEFFNTITGVLLASLQADGSPSADFGANGVNKIDLGQNTEQQDRDTHGCLTAAKLRVRQGRRAAGRRPFRRNRPRPDWHTRCRCGCSCGWCCR